MIGLLALAGLPVLLELVAAVTVCAAAAKVTLEAVEIARRLRKEKGE